MKKILQASEPASLRAAEKRFTRSIRMDRKGRRATKKRKTRSDEPDFGMAIAPTKLDLYSPKNHSRFVDFLQEIRRSVSAHEVTTLNMKHCIRITAAAGLLLVAEVDRLTKAYPLHKIKCINPEASNNGPGKSGTNLVESALNQIGFYKIIGQSNSKKAVAGSVKKWRHLSGYMADGNLADSLLQTLKDEVSAEVLKKLYRGSIEAIANCVEHAYPSARRDGLNIIDPRWWMLVGKDETSLTIIICDLGVGIPNTLPVKHEESFLSQIKNALGIVGNSDSEMIRISTHIKQTRTNQKHRGKGGKDFRSMPANFPSSYLAIRSNKGAFFITGKEHIPFKGVSSRKFVPDTQKSESMIEHKNSICGTLIEWAIPLKDLQK
ncbi:hypothetical protein [Pseudomonas syringae]|uniref:hypothetical protein n=1 Tax=Pseudomonas syringae TaxID=317 RepID=UPI001F0EBE5B|nr:hypothetical protein [Pseudomonas syringae]MCH5486763.1 hypothetical protein [Pseudomonas syringae pv. syringae]MDO1457663.1 hypothetical protein [Pseudomonas syringae pv. syringae]